MKSRLIKVLVLAALLWNSVVFAPPELKATSESTIRFYNVAGQAALTLLRAVIQGKIKNFKQVAKALAFGSVSGYGFYQAKKMIGEGHVTTGVILANISASVSENISNGDHPFSYLGYSLGPARMEIATPFAQKPQAIFNISISVNDLVALYYSIKDAGRVSFRDGLILFTADEPISENVIGWTRGIYPTVLSGQPDSVFHHEAIHSVQNLQLMSISPEEFMDSKSNSENKKSLFRIYGVRLNALGSLNDLLFSKIQNYEDRWFEVEAYHFTAD